MKFGSLLCACRRRVDRPSFDGALAGSFGYFPSPLALLIVGVEVHQACFFFGERLLYPESRERRAREGRGGGRLAADQIGLDIFAGGKAGERHNFAGKTQAKGERIEEPVEGQ